MRTKRKFLTVLLTLLVSSCMVSNVRMQCGLASPHEYNWYVHRLISSGLQSVGLPLDASDQVISDWIKTHPGCCAARPTEPDPVRRMFYGSDILTQVVHKNQIPPINENFPYRSIVHTYTTCGNHAAERTGSSELKTLLDTIEDYPIKGWEVTE